MGTSHPVPEKWEPFRDQFSDSAPEVPPTFLTCTKARLVGGDEALQFLEPVEDDVDLGERPLPRVTGCFDHHESLAIRRHIVLWCHITPSVAVESFKQRVPYAVPRVNCISE